MFLPGLVSRLDWCVWWCVVVVRWMKDEVIMDEVMMDEVTMNALS